MNNITAIQILTNLKKVALWEQAQEKHCNMQ